MRKTIMLALAGALVLAGCTTKKERAPGPLTVWVAAEDSELMTLRLMADDFRRLTGIPLELVTKSSYELQFSLLRHPEDLEGVDVVEADYFDLPELADRMQILKRALEGVEGGNRLYVEAVNAGVIGGTQRFLPWRLSWPALVGREGYVRPDSFSGLAARAEQDQVSVMLPALEDNEFFALLCAMAWSVQADPSVPGPNLSRAMNLYARLARVVPMDAAATAVGGAADRGERPDVFFDWPRGILAVGTDIPMEMESGPLPCGKGSCVPFFGRYLASPEGAPHPEEAVRFIQFMLSPQVQSRLATETDWLPVRSDGLTDLAGRQDAYQGIRAGATLLRPLPRGEKTRQALVAAGRKIFFEGATAEQGMEEFKSRMP